jgi:hypothetical protein
MANIKLSYLAHSKKLNALIHPNSYRTFESNLLHLQLQRMEGYFLKPTLNIAEEEMRMLSTVLSFVTQIPCMLNVNLYFIEI